MSLISQLKKETQMVSDDLFKSWLFRPSEVSFLAHASVYSFVTWIPNQLL